MTKDFFTRLYKILPRQSWLTSKENEFWSLIDNCKDSEHQDLIFDLIERFNYVSQDLFIKYLESMADYIINETGFEINKTQIVGMTMDDNPDSSQWILHQLKSILTQKGWNNVKITNRFDKGIKIMNKENLTQLVLVDEFIGSGQSVEGRIKILKERANTEFEIKACFISGMEFGIERVSKSFADFKCFIPLKKAISEFYVGEAKDKAIDQMKNLEDTLLQKINHKNLPDYHLGYGNAEALYSSVGNTPNSVFPYFWWPYDSKEQKRETIFIRNEEGLGL